MNSERPYDGLWVTDKIPMNDDQREDKAAWLLCTRFNVRPSLVYRARLRLRRNMPYRDPSDAGRWVVVGDLSYDDLHDLYYVTDDDGRLSCSCWGHEGGGYRQRNWCSHVVVVALARRRRGEEFSAERPEPPAPEEAPVKPDTAPPEVQRPTPALKWSNPADLGLPFDAFRAVQLIALHWISNSKAKVLLLQAPTGSGKSLVAAASGKVLGHQVLYCAPTKILQDQFLRSFPTSRLLKGRSNYTPLNYADPEDGCKSPSAHEPGVDYVTCDECEAQTPADRCPHCHTTALCPYTLARDAAFGAEFAVLNTAYWIAEANYGRRFSDAKSSLRRLVVLDEGDSLESQLMSVVEVSLRASLLKELDIEPPRYKTPNEAHKLDEWVPWFKDIAIPAMDQRLDALLKQKETLISELEHAEGAADDLDAHGDTASELDESLASVEREIERMKARIDEAERDGSTQNTLRNKFLELVQTRSELEGTQRDLPGDPVLKVAAGREIGRIRRELSQVTRSCKRIERSMQQSALVVRDMEQNPASWVRVDDPSGGFFVKPVHVGRFAEEFIWRHGTRFLVMSATIVDKAQFASDLGLDVNAVDYIELPTSFPIDRRPIYYTPAGDMSRRMQSSSLPATVAAIDKILQVFPHQRGIIHTVSYQLSSAIRERTAFPERLITFDPAHRDQAVASVSDTTNGVLIGPALERGVDLPGELCRFQIIPKMMYPSLGDRQVAMRMYGFGHAGKRWYAIKTIRELCQSTGRGMRSDEDFVASFILDSQFGEFRRKWAGLFPYWWSSSLVTGLTLDEALVRWVVAASGF